MGVVERDDVLSVLSVRPSGDGFTGSNLDHPSTRVFGGQVLAQCVAALAASSPDKPLRSLHVAFGREGDLAQDVQYEARCVKPGRTFETWSVRAHQGDATIAHALASMSTDNGEFDFSVDDAPRPAPDACEAVDLQLVPWETRACPGHQLSVRDSAPGEYAFWMRTDPALEGARAQAALAYVSDLVLVATALLPISGWSIDDAHHDLVTAVTTHTIWFHRPVAPDEWMCFDQHVRSVTGEVAVGDGTVRSGDGTLVVSFAQECVVRVRP